MIDLTTTPRAELAALLGAAQQALAALDAQEAQEAQEARQGIAQAVASLDALLGAPSDPPYDPTDPHSVANIRSVRKHPAEVLEANAGPALALLLEGLEILTTTTRAVAWLVAESIRED